MPSRDPPAPIHAVLKGAKERKDLQMRTRRTRHALRLGARRLRPHDPEDAHTEMADAGVGADTVEDQTWAP